MNKAEVQEIYDKVITSRSITAIETSCPGKPEKELI